MMENVLRPRRAWGLPLIALTLLAAPVARAAEADGPAAVVEPKETTWSAIAPDIFPEQVVGDAEGVVALAAPTRAEDAALVPLTVSLSLPPGDPRSFKGVTVVIDENPSPVAGRFSFGDGQKDFALSLRTRVNSYSYVRAIAETNDGKLHMAKAYVKAAGGCSAPATKDTADSIAHLGDIRFRSFADAGKNEAQVQIRHPNFSGLQMDEATRGYTPAWFVREVKITQGGHLLLGMEGGISISEDPTFRFSYKASAEPVTVRAEDTEGKVFTRTFPGGGS
ncbi:quinoprotein dehydrogenase-associated SoxYZ-like carrier [Xanthobacter variabilis]|uniref:quinoprotein dehydrogenase-associated SoxYZ-like carrier n=1 Tax=Xanthobacter variabilis TaxID=3119932 RepID=UPI00374F4F37